MQNIDLGLLLRQRSLIDKLQKYAKSKKTPIIGKHTGYFLEFAVMTVKPSNVLEIGCGNGFSTYFILKNLNEGSKYTGIDMNKKRLFAARNFIGTEYPDSHHEFIWGNALKKLSNLDGIYDLIFIDAAKFEYPLYLAALKNKIKKGTLIIADDIYCKGHLLSALPKKHFKNSVKGINIYLQSTSRKNGFDTWILDIDDGLSVSFYRRDSEIEK